MYSSVKMSRHRQKVSSFVRNKIDTWVHGEARGGLRTATGKRIAFSIYQFINSLFFLLCLSARILFSLAGGMIKSTSAHFGYCGPKPD